jgi:hypothetical protein
MRSPMKGGIAERFGQPVSGGGLEVWPALAFVQTTIAETTEVREEMGKGGSRGAATHVRIRNMHGTTERRSSTARIDSARQKSYIAI